MYVAFYIWSGIVNNQFRLFQCPKMKCCKGQADGTSSYERDTNSRHTVGYRVKLDRLEGKNTVVNRSIEV